ncbi:MAG: hypothetical protein HXY23_05415 [Parvularculaceae bacterium]|nr:hypothetical protein [Parvularculaceae bacterium]
MQYDLVVPRFKTGNVVAKGEKLYLAGAGKLLNSYYTSAEVLILGEPDAQRVDGRSQVHGVSAGRDGMWIAIRSEKPLDPIDYHEGLHQAAALLASFRSELINDGAPNADVALLMVPSGDNRAYESGLRRVKSGRAEFSYTFSETSLRPRAFNACSRAYEKLGHELYHGPTAI